MSNVGAAGGFRATVKIAKRDDAKMRVFGIALRSTDESGKEVVDHDGNYFTPEEMEEAAYDHLVKSRAMNTNHEGDDSGYLIASVPLTPDIRKAMGVEPGPSMWFVGYQLTNKDDWAKVQSGELAELSIEGSALVEAP